MNAVATSTILSILCYLLCNPVLAIPIGDERCPPSSCGSLKNISYPFRLKGDSQECGKYELICKGNDTILSLCSGKYYVKEISFDNSTIRIVDANVASGSCRLPSLSFTDDEFEYQQNHTGLYYVIQYSYFTFVNCTREIDDMTYQPIRCLSGSSSTVYSTYNYDVDSLVNSCSFITMIPADSSPISGGNEIFDTLRHGFLLTWPREESFARPSRVDAIHYCWQEANVSVYYYRLEPYRDYPWIIHLFKGIPFISREFGFLYCLKDTSHFGSYHKSKLTFPLAVMLAILINISALSIILSILGRFIISPLSILVFIAYKSWDMHLSVDIVEKFLRTQPSLVPKRYSYMEIVSMTNNFKEKLGQGGFGSVFKGRIPGGPLVAVKILGNSKCNGDEFISEVSTIGSIHHVNIVNLVGFCSEGLNRALLYEFMPNGSLDRYIFSNGSNRQFTTEKLHEIALGVARGIDYLHQGCDMRILHFDIKPHNILLDHRFTPKVLDFGLAKLYPKDHSLVAISAARGTIGYIAPELISRSFGVISHKSDVYSFGMLLLEMAGRRRNVDPRRDESSQVYYPSWIYDKLNQSQVSEISEPLEIDGLERKLCIIGLWCIQMRSNNRPSMTKVIEMLEADVDTLQMPPKPFLFSSQQVSVEQSCLESSTAQLSIISEST